MLRDSYLLATKTLSLSTLGSWSTECRSRFDKLQSWGTSPAQPDACICKFIYIICGCFRLQHRAELVQDNDDDDKIEMTWLMNSEMFCRSGENLKTAVVDKQKRLYGGDSIRLKLR